MGTSDFLSPEACGGKPTDERGDISSFGVLLFEMLTGETPFAGDTLSAKLAAILTQPVPEWMHQQVYLHPYPKELMLRNYV